MDPNARNQLISSGLAWLLEMEYLNSGPVKNALILNIQSVSPRIRDIELIADERGKKMLVYLEVTRFWQYFRGAQINESVLEILTQTLPNYSFRVIYDRPLFEKALAKAAQLAEARAKVPSPKDPSPPERPKTPPVEPAAAPEPSAAEVPIEEPSNKPNES